MRRKTPSPRQRALLEGNPRYFTKKPCKNGHTHGRYTCNSSCVTCAAEAHRLYQKTHPKKMYELSRRWIERNSEAVKIKNREYKRKIRARARTESTSPPTSRDEALERGEKFFYPETACVRGHHGKRYSRNGTCVRCQLLYDRTYHEKHPRSPEAKARVKEYLRNYYRKKKEEMKSAAEEAFIKRRKKQNGKT